MHHNLNVLSLSHTSAPLEIRELLYLPEQECRQLLLQFTESIGLQEAIVFSTCNRTEVYYISEEDMSEKLISLLFSVKGLAESQAYRSYFRHITNNKEAITYVFEVSMGLYSSVLGDLQISNQIKKAYTLSHEAGLSHAFLHRLMHTIFHTHKRVQQETSFRDGAASVSYAAAELIEELSSHLPAPKVLILGLGEMGKDVALSLHADDFDEMYLCNRSYEKAQELAEQTGTTPLPFDQLTSTLPKVDIIVSAVSVDQPIINVEAFDKDSLQTQYLLDLSVPRSVHKEVEELSHTVVFHIDDIHTRTEAVLTKRKAAIPHVKEIVREEVEGFSTWSRELQLSPTIHKIKSALEQIRQEEMARFLKNATQKETKMIEAVTQNMVHKILRMPVLQLKAACKRGEQEELIDILNELFDLESRENMDIRK